MFSLLSYLFVHQNGAGSDEYLKQGWTEYQAEQDEIAAPLRNRLTVVGSLIADNQAQLERLIDLYLNGDFPKEALSDRKKRIETTLSGLEREQEAIRAQLDERVLTREQMQNIREFITVVREELPSANFETRRKIVKMLNVEVTLTVEDGEKVIYSSCILGKSAPSLVGYNVL